MKRIIKMRHMCDNQRGIIKKVTGTGDMGRRIREMGLVPETTIQIQGRIRVQVDRGRQDAFQHTLDGHNDFNGAGGAHSVADL